MKILLIASLAVSSLSAFAHVCSSTGKGNLTFKAKCNDDAERSVTLSKIRVAHNGMFYISMYSASTICSYIGMDYVTSEVDYHYFGWKEVASVIKNGSNLDVINTFKHDHSLGEVTCRSFQATTVEVPAPTPSVSNN